MPAPEQSSPLTGFDYEEIIRCLDEAIAVFERRTGGLTAVEVRSKSILGAIRSELRERVKDRRNVGRQ